MLFAPPEKQETLARILQKVVEAYPSTAALTGRRDRTAFLAVSGRVLLVGLLLRHLLSVCCGVEKGKPAQDRGLRDAGQRSGLPQERSLQLSVQRP